MRVWGVGLFNRVSGLGLPFWGLVRGWNFGLKALS